MATSGKAADLFTYNWLREYLKKIDSHHPLVRLGDWSQGRRAILRFDVDLDLEWAGKVARVLSESQIYATFCLLVSCPYYNLAAPNSLRVIREMVAGGNEVALHFDPTVYPEAGPEALPRLVRQEADWLERCSGVPVRSLSLHNPHAMGALPLFEGFVNAYDPQIFAAGRYLSDSCRRFRTNPDDFCKTSLDLSEPIQLLFHPELYASEERNYEQIFAEFEARQSYQMDAAFREANPVYRSERPERKFQEGQT